VALANKLAVAFGRKGVTTTPTRDAKDRTNEYYGFRVALGVAGKNKYADKLVSGIDASLKSKLDSQISKSGYGMLFVQPAESITPTPDKKKIPVLLVVAKDSAGLESAVSALAADLEKTGGIELPADANAAGIDSLVENAGLALINNGMPGNSVEYNGTITLTLLRSSTGWPSGKHYFRNFETENWNHRYSYALLPHAGDWMQAKMWRAGAEFNNPLAQVVGKTCRKGAWPSAMSLLSTSGGDAVISALKLKGFPFIDGKKPANGGSLVLRLYNPTGFATSEKVKFHLPLESVKGADMLENEGAAMNVSGDSFNVELDPFAIETYVFKPKAKAEKAVAKLGPASEPVDVFATRYWETNQGVAAYGFQPVALVLEPGPIDVAKKNMTVFVTVANSSKDRDYSGKVTLLSPGKNSGPLSYSLKPGESTRIKASVSGFDPAKLKDMFISARTKVDGVTLEDSMPFNDWKVIESDVKEAKDLNLNAAGWKTMPLARFWSSGLAKKGTYWYTREIFVPKDMGDMPLHLERAPGSEVSMFVNGLELRTMKDGRAYPPLFGGSIKYGDKNLFAIRVVDNDGTGEMYAAALQGSEPLYSKPMVKFASDKVALKPGKVTKVKLTISNPYSQNIDVAAQLVSPVETWPGGGRFSLLKAGPAVVNVSVPANGKKNIEYSIDVPPDAMPGPHWAVVKLVFAGQTSYSMPVDMIVTE